MSEILNGKIEERELKREILHILTGIAALFLIIYGIITPLIIFFILILALFLSFLSLRIKVPPISWFLNNFERKKDIEELPGRALIFAFVGCLLVLRLFPLDMALASIAILTFADPISHLVGKCFGRIPSILDRRKNIEGHVVGFLASSAIALFFVSPLLAFAGSFIAVTFESMIIEVQKMKLDDNLIIPLAAGTAMYLLSVWI